MLSPCHSPSIYYACCNQSDLPKTFTWHSITFLCSKFFSHVSSPGRCKSILLNKAFKTFNELITFSTSHANLLLSLYIYIYTLFLQPPVCCMHLCLCTCYFIFNAKAWRIIIPILSRPILPEKHKNFTLHSTHCSNTISFMEHSLMIPT